MENATYIPRSWNLPDAIRLRLGETVGRQRLIDEDGHLLLLLHAPPRAEDDEVRSAVVVWRDPAGEWKSFPVDGGLAGLEKHLTRYRTAIHQLDDEVESARSARQYFEVMRHMHPLQRATRSMVEVIQGTREALEDDTRIITLRDLATDLERAIELVASDAKAGMDFTLAESANQQAISSEAANQEARRLNRLAAFFFPLATLVTVFGMNPPEDIYQHHGFWIVLAAGLVLGLIVYGVVALTNRRRE
ncbi:MAG: CorA family divalent cation transporter [Verrucomicrobiota bacterium]